MGKKMSLRVIIDVGYQERAHRWSDIWMDT